MTFPFPLTLTLPSHTPTPHREMNEHNIEIGIIGADRKFRILSPSEVRLSLPLSFPSLCTRRRIYYIVMSYTMHHTHTYLKTPQNIKKQVRDYLDEAN